MLACIIMHHIDVATSPFWSGLANRTAIVRPVREFDRLVFAITHEITPISAAPRHLVYVLKVFLIVSRITVDVAKL